MKPMKTTLTKAFALLFLTSGVLAGAQTLRESISTDTFHPASNAFDSSFNTGWKLSAGETAGWIEAKSATAKRYAGAMVNLRLAEGTSLQVSALAGESWVAISSARLQGPIDENVWLSFPFDLPATTRLLFRLQGSDASASAVYNVDLVERTGPAPWGKILPATYSVNVGEVINLKASRLWDGITKGVWYEPIWSIPYEVSNSANAPVGVFGPMGHPQTNAQIVWELAGFEEIHVLKAYFLQDYRSLKFEFWNGSAWTAGVSFDAVGGTGWKRVELDSPVTTNRIRISFPGGWERARFIGEVEVWGSNGETIAPRSLVLPPPAADGKLHAIADGNASGIYEIQALSNAQTLNFDFNGSAQTANAVSRSNVSNVTTYRFRPKDWDVRKPGPQFLRLGADVTSVTVRPFDAGGRIAVSSALNDEDASTPAISNVPELTWSLNAAFQLEKIRVFSPALNAAAFFTKRTNTITPIVWTQSGSGWWEAKLSGRSADAIGFTSEGGISISEIQLYGSREIDTEVPIERWWPPLGATVNANDSDTVSFLGWMGDASVVPTISGYHPRQADKLFWMPLKDMGLSAGSSANLLWIGTLAGNSKSETYRVHWKKQNENFTLDQTTAFLATEAASLTLSGGTADNASRVFVGGVEVPVTAKRWSVNVPLALGYRTLAVDVYNPSLNKLRAHFEKGVYRVANAVQIELDLPASDLATSDDSIRIAGRVCGIALTLTKNGQPLALSEGSFATTEALVEGINTFALTVTDSLGRSTTRTLTVVRDTSAPVVTIVTPAQGTITSERTVTVAADALGASGLWWSLNGGLWEAGVHSWSLVHADGTYTATVGAKDRSGNLSAVRSVTYTVDATPPLAFSIDADVLGWTSDNRPTLSFQTIDVTTGVARWEYAIDAGAFYPTSSPLTLPALGDGEHIVFVKATDGAGNSTIAQIELKIDTQAPEVPSNLEDVSDLESVRLRWSHDTQSDSATVYQIQRTPAWSEGTRSTSNRTYTDTEVDRSQTYTYRVRAVDRAQNVSAWSEEIVVLPGQKIEPVEPGVPTSLETGRTNVQIAAGALASEIVQIAMTEFPKSTLTDAPENPIVGDVYSVSVVRSVGGVEEISAHALLSTPATVTLNYDPAQIPPGYTEADLKAFYYDTVWGRWIDYPMTIVDAQNDRIIFQTTHFTDFTVQATKAADLTSQQLRDTAYSLSSATTNQAPVTVSGTTGSVSTSFTEFVLPGKNRFDLTIKRVYDSSVAMNDHDIVPTPSPSPVPSNTPLPTPSPTPVNVNAGSDPWKAGEGWRIQFPSMKWTSGGLWITTADGNVASVEQMSFAPPTTEETNGVTTMTIGFNVHENQDISAAMSFTKRLIPHGSQWGTTYTPEYTFKEATVFEKDGRTTRFDAGGRVAEMTDPTGKNKLTFSYTSAKTTITDSMGRKIDFTYKDGRIDEINVQAAPAGETYRVAYGYSGKELTTATDVGGRLWNYGYTDVTQEKLYRTSSDTRDTKTYRMLASVSGPGVGEIGIGWSKKKVKYSIYSTASSSGYYTEYDYLFANALTVKNDTTLERTYTYGYDFKEWGELQLQNNTFTVGDGRTLETTTYQHITKQRGKLSWAPEALRLGYGFENPGDAPHPDELLNLTGTVSKKGLTSNTDLETQTYTWETGRVRLLTLNTQRASDNYKKNTYEYDGWGNVTKAIEETKVGTRTTKRTQEARYYNAGNGNLNLGIAGLNLSEPSLTRNNRTLVAATQTTLEGDTPSTPVTVIERSYNLYTPLGQASDTHRWTGSAWAKTQYAYDANTAEVTQITAPSGQVTQLAYAYPAANSNAGTYTVSVTQKNVTLDALNPAAVTDLVKTQTFDRLSGNATATTDERGFTTSKTYDKLGRVTRLQEPNDQNPASPLVTTVTYDDTALTSTVTPPRGAKIVYRFDRLGRLTQVDKIVAPDETVTTKLDYNGWGDVTALRGPVDDKTDASFGRTLSNLVTTFAYDDFGRVKETKAPGATNPHTITYDNATNTATETDELGHLKRTQTDWMGNPIKQGVYVNGTWIETHTYYDGAGRTIATVDAEGNVTTTTYNAQGLEASVKLPARTIGGISVVPELVKTYDQSGYLIQTTQALDDGKTRTVNLFNNTLGKVLTSETPVTVNGSVQTIQTRHTYDQLFNVTAQDSGVKIGSEFHGKTWTYDSHNRRVSETDEEGRTTTYSYDSVGNRNGVTDPREGLYPDSRFKLALNYDQLNRLMDAVLPAENTATETAVPRIGIDYDGRGNVVQRTEANGQITKYTYTLRNQLKTQTTSDATTNYTTTYTYDDAGRQIAVTSPSGAVTYSEYDEAGRIVRSGNDTIGWTSFTYWPNGGVKTQTDGRGNTTSYTYNPDGKVLTVTDAFGKVTTTVYDRWNQIVQTVDSEGGTRSNSYDELGRLVSETNPRGKTATWTYDAWNNATLYVDANGTTFTRTYDKTNRLLSETATNGAQTHTKTYTYDESGDVTTVTDGSGTDGSVATTYNSASGSYRPNPYGLVTSKTDSFGANSLTMQYRYDASQRLTGVTNPDGSVVNYTYNALNQITGVPNWITGNVNYDGFGRLSDYTLANGVKKTVTYDANDRLVGLGYAKGSTALKDYALTYDQAQNITNKNDNVYGYDALNRLIGANEKGWFAKKSDEIAANYAVAERDYTGTKQMAFTLNPLSTIGLDGAKKSFAVDLGKVYGVSKLEIVPQNASHRIRQKDLTILVSKDNQNYTVTNAWVMDRKTDGTLVITFNEVFETRMIKIATKWDDRDLENNSVDKATFRNIVGSILKVSALSKQHLEAYEYDSMGNRTKLTEDGTVKTSTYYKNAAGGNLPLIQTDGEWSYTYDDNGNRIGKTKLGETWSYVWDLYNRLVEVKKNGATLVTYLYDGQSLRVQRTGSNGTTVYAYGRKGALTYQKNTTKNEARTFAYFNSTILGWTDTKNSVQSKYFAVTDHLGSTTQVTDASGNVVWSGEHLPYGNLASSQGNYEFDGMYTGVDIDSDTELRYHQFRWASEDGARFLSEDPIRTGNNWVIYANNSPQNYVDRTGLIILNFLIGLDGEYNAAHQETRETFIRNREKATEAINAPHKNDGLFGWSILSSQQGIWGLFMGSAYGGGVYGDKKLTRTQFLAVDPQDRDDYVAKWHDLVGMYGLDYMKNPETYNPNNFELGVSDLVLSLYFALTVLLPATDVKGNVLGLEAQMNHFVNALVGIPVFAFKAVSNFAIGIGKTIQRAITNFFSWMFGMPTRDAIPEAKKPEAPKPEESATTIEGNTSDGSSPSNTNNSETGPSTSVSGGGGTIICTELHRQGLMSDLVYQADREFGKKLEDIAPLVLNGYRFLAAPIVKEMQKSKEFTMLVYGWAKPWADQMAQIMGKSTQGHWFGLMIMIVGIPICGLIGFLIDYFLLFILLGIGVIMINVQKINSNRKQTRNPGLLVFPLIAITMLLSCTTVSNSSFGKLITFDVDFVGLNNTYIIEGSYYGERQHRKFYIFNPATSQLNQLAIPLEKIYSPSVSPDGNVISFTYRGTTQGPDQSTIYTYEIQTMKLNQVTRNGIVAYSPEWSKNSKRLFFLQDEKTINVLYYKDYEKNGETVRVDKLARFTSNPTPDFDGNRVSYFYGFDVFGGDDTSRIDVMDIEKKMFETILKVPSYQRQALSTDGKYVYFFGRLNKNEKQGLYKIEIETKKSELIHETNLYRFDYFKMRSDGKKFLWETLKGFEVFDIDTKEVVEYIIPRKEISVD